MLVYPGFNILYPTSGWIDWAPWYKWGPANGGTTTQVGTHLVHTFDQPGTYQFTSYWTMNIRYLVIAGGGGAGYASGGAGGFQEGTMTIGPGTYQITVGRGGNGRGGDGSVGDNGENSSFYTITSLGGGGGGNRYANGRTGGSGGGGSYQSGPSGGTAGQGYNGAGYYWHWYGAGGGAGGHAYWDGSYSYPGPGKYTDISGTSQLYAQGGNTPWHNRGAESTPGKGGNYYTGGGQNGIVILRYDAAPIELAYRAWVKKNYDDKINELEESKKKEVAALETKNAELIAQAKKERETLEAEVKSLEATNAALEEKLKAVQMQLTMTQEQLAEKKQELTETKLEYEKKLNDLKDMQAKEKAAIEAENEKAANEAKAAQIKLMDELLKLKSDYTNIAAQLQGTAAQLKDVEQELVDTKDAYEGKMKELEAAKQAEVNSLKEQNKDAAAIAQSEQQRLSEELGKLKEKYEALQQESAKCPIIPEGAVVLDGQTGTLYKFQDGALRKYTFEAYKSHGSPRYTTFSPGKLDLCPKGPPMEEVTTPAPTTPSPTVTTPPPTPEFDGTVYVFVHAQSWDESGQLKVMSARFGAPVVESFNFQDVNQAWMVSSNGYIRSLAGQGEYVSNNEKCLAPIMGRNVPETTWSLQSRGSSSLEYSVRSECGTYLTSDTTGRGVSLESYGAGSRWYMVPVGKANV